MTDNERLYESNFLFIFAGALELLPETFYPQI
ncbi:hypothetical protein MCO_00450 [Bartonella sp. DB5-6]|nr:hypothetical protein MCO_00450 [Bartonella sp. DB5-6]